MVPPDYQEFANRQRARCRDNSVICGASATQALGNQSSVARLPRRFKGTKAELSINVETWSALGGRPQWLQNQGFGADLRAKNLS
jgi:hypothetical protein